MSTSAPIRPSLSVTDVRQLSLFSPEGVSDPREVPSATGSPCTEWASSAPAQSPESSAPDDEAVVTSIPINEPTDIGPPLGELSSATRPALSPRDEAATLGDVLRRLRDDPGSASSSKRAHMKSALTTVGRVLDRPLSEIPANPATLGTLLADASPALAGIKPHRWSRVRSLTLSALREVGMQVMPGRDINGLNTKWRELCNRLPHKRYRNGLSRLLSFFSREGLMPEDIDTEAFARFRTALFTTSLHGSPKLIFSTTIRLWNMASANVFGWPDLILPMPRNPRLYSIGWNSFPPSFCADVEAFLAHTGNQDPLADDYAPSVRPSTIAMRRKQILQMASALVSSGMNADEVLNLAMLVDPGKANALLRYLLDRKGGKTTPYLGQQAQLLLTISRHWVKAPAENTASVRRYASRLAIRRTGMVEKNRTLLRQFDLADNVDALLALPARVLREIQTSNAGSNTDALRMMFALAVEILIVAPMRADNLIGLQWDRHIVATTRGRHQSRHIAIPAHETKTSASFEMAFPKTSCPLLDAYLHTYRPSLSSSAGPWLFPDAKGERRSTAAFSQAISKFVLRETGIKMNIHLFRHLAVKLYLEVHPEDIETARRLLGHTSSATLLRSYAELRDDHAFRRYDNVISDRRARLTQEIAPRSLATRRRARK